MIKPIPTSPSAALPYQGMPVGSVIAFAGDIRKDSGDQSQHKTNLFLFKWLLCDGSKVLIGQYPELYQALGYTYGGSGAEFALPDYRGTFLRGVGTSDASLEDREAASEHGSKNGVGSTQQHAMLSHKHKYSKPSKGTTVPAEPPGGLTASPLREDKTTEPDVQKPYLSELENRPDNTFVNWLIKATM